MRQKLYIQISPTSLAYVDSGKEGFAERLMAWASFSRAKLDGYVQLAEVDLDVEIDTDRNSLAQKAVASLRVEQANIRAKAAKECNDLETLAQQLLAIENKPSAPAGKFIRSPMDVAYDHGYEVKKDTASDYYMWSARNWVEDSPATFDTPEEAARDVLGRLCLDEDGLPI